MLNWLWENVPKFIGIAGFLLAGFNQWSIWRDRRDRKQAEAPRARIRTVTRGSPESVAIFVEFKNTRPTRLLLEEVRMREPKGVGLVIADQPPDEAAPGPARKVEVQWIVKSADENGGVAGTRLFVQPLDGNSLDPLLGKGKRLAIAVRGTEIDRPSRKVEIVAATVMPA